MDIAKLEKMKVVDLRNELQSRNLDIKGVKAVLIERLRAHMEDGGGGGGTPGTPGTPGRRSRRTRSMTRSPSPSPVKKLDPTLEPLEEEDAANAPVIAETSREETAEEEQMEADPSETVAKSDELQEESESKEEDDNEEAEQETEENESADANGSKEREDVSDSEPMEEDEGKNLKEVNEANEDRKMDVDSEAKAATEVITESAETEPKSDLKNDNEVEGVVKGEEEPLAAASKESRKRSHSASRSRSHSRERQNHSRSRSKSRSRSRSPKRRSGAAGSQHESPSKAIEEATNPEDEPTIEDKQFGLSWFDSDLHLRIDPVTFTSAKPMTHEVYSLVWSGVRTNYGVRDGKVCFEVRLAEETQMGRSHQFRDEPHVRGFRVGFSLINHSLILGESENSFGYCESGRKALNSEFVDYGKPYKLDDVIGCYLDLESTPCTIRYTLNGEDQGVAFEFEKSVLGETEALFPHIVTKGYEFHVNFADNENLLGNVERPKRMRRKPRKEKEVTEDAVEAVDDKNNKTKDSTDSNAEGWKVVDETKADDVDEGDEVDVKKQDDESKNEEKSEENTVQEKSEENTVQEKSEENTVQGNVEMNDEEKEIDVKKNENKVDEDKIQEEKTEEEPAEKSAPIEAEVEATSENDKKIDDSSADPESENSEKQTEDEIVEAEKQKNHEEEKSSPSPTKRQKLDDEKRNPPSEDEYEEVVPEPREAVSLLEDYELIALIPEEKYVTGPQRPESRKECEVILLVGLPGAGKTHWTLNRVKENPEKRYHIIGADALIAKMTIEGVSRKTIHKGRWDRVYELCINSLSSLEEIAAKRRRNFILDQTNAYASAQRRKMKGFGDFKRIAVVCIPNEDELKRRNSEKTENGNAYSIRDSTLNNIRANFTLPSLEFGWFDEIIYTDLSGDEAKEEVKKYNEKKNINRGVDKRIRRDDRRDDRRVDTRWNDRRRDFRTDNRWSDRRGGQGHQGGGGSGGNRWGGGGGGGGGGAGGGGRGYDNRNRNYNSGQQNWMQNTRNRYDDRYNRSGGGAGSGGGGGGRYDSRYDSYGGGGGGGGSRDYRDRERDRNGGGGGNRRDNYRSGGGGSNQRDFRPGHRDNQTEDSRGGYERSYNSNEGYDQYSSGKATVGKGPVLGGGKWSSYAQHLPHQTQHNPLQQHPQQQQHGSGNWQQHSYQQPYWGFNEMQGYGNQQQWQSSDQNQQQEWMSWWQQQGNAQQPQATSNEANHYWSQYSYPTQGTPGSAEATKK